MPTSSRSSTRGAWLVIGGFACYQGFLYAVLYFATRWSSKAGSFVFERADLVGLLVFVVAAFAVVRAASPAARARMLGSRALFAYSLMPTVGYLVQLLPLDAAVASLAEGVFMGLPAGLLLCAWGRLLGQLAVEHAIPEVFLASAIGAVIDFGVSMVPVERAEAVFMLLPLASFAFACALMRGGLLELDAAAPASSAPVSDAAARLSGRIVAGTAVYGVAAGLVETFASAREAVSSLTFALLMFVLYCLAALQLFGAVVRLPRSDERRAARDAAPLDGAYRLAVLLMTAGFLLVPVLDAFGLYGGAVVLAGYLGVSTVLIALFLAMGRIGGHDTALSFAVGFTALFAGEIAGVLAGNAIESLAFEHAASITVALAGIAVIYGFLFLFTTRDLRDLSVAVENTDLFDEACARIAREAGLSKREAEILPMALRGRTSERMATELFISKNTVDTHLRRIYAKCEVKSRQELIDLGEQTQQALRP
ncbi:MAG: LuxR C-terminal-related transcriptional regulator [Eggerthellaceae bacterium]|nr:LuxR C-terminal-related transcriptional regulator [Eggerthellaceae bacterium]